MAKILIKLKKDSIKQFLTTSSGYTITKDEFAEVDDKDPNIHAYIINRDDIEIADLEEKQKINEGSVKNTLKEEVKKEPEIVEEESKSTLSFDEVKQND